MTIDALGQFLGRLHPIVVHFPIALLVVGAMVEVWNALRRKIGPSPTSLVCIGFGAAGAIAAAGMGWLNAAFEQADNTSWVLSWHRWIGVTVAGLSATVLMLAWISARKAGAVRVYRAGLVLSALLVGVGGHLGGMLTYGDNYITGAVVALWRGPTPEPAPRPTIAPPQPAPNLASGTLTIDFETQVRPILLTSCISCHGPNKKKGGLRLDNAEDAAIGGKDGAVLVPGDSNASELFRRLITDDDLERMPLDKDPLPSEQIELIRKWIDEGAHWPAGPTSQAAPIHEQEHWAYVAPKRPDPPRVRDAAWARNPIDSFILARLEQAGLAPSPEAERAVLIRRVTLDLIGLPPTVAEVDAFLADQSPDAYERVVDRLLASTSYGERWARPWLDLARYADSNGYEKDGTRSMWLWRDWVIDALNADMPFDEFTIEQLAGDRLPAPTQAQIIATGFHRNTMINEEGGVDPEEYRVNAVIDRANTTATVWLGSTMGCAQCHDHKFDPFSQKEYFGFYAFFNSDAPEMHNNASEYAEISPKLRTRDPRDAELWTAIEAAENAITPDLPTAQATAMYAQVDALRLTLRPDVTTLVMRQVDPPRATHILKRGDFRNPGDEVAPDVPAVLPALPEGARDRAALARWLVSPANPLTARVTVNRMWEQHFGRGIVETCEDFGIRGTPPTHPELLDWLATEFVRVGWSQKAMQRLIVTSATYRQSSDVSPALLEADPQNKWLARAPRPRLEAEMVRDQALAVGGLLSAKIGGPSVFPVQPDGIWANPYADNTWRTSEGEDRHRRSLYTFWKRTSPYPAFGTFDAPTRQLACTRRMRSNTPLQALTTLNDPVYVEAAAALAGRTLKEAEPDARARAEWAFRACVARRPDEDEISRLLELYRQQAANFEADPGAAHELVSTALGGAATDNEVELASWTVVANVLMNLDEFLTRG